MNDFIKKWIKWYAWIFPIIINIFNYWGSSFDEYITETFSDIFINYFLVIPVFIIYKIYKNLEMENKNV